GVAPARRALALASLGFLRWGLGDTGAAVALATAGIGFADEAADEHARAGTRYLWALVLGINERRWDEAIPVCQEAASLARGLGIGPGDWLLPYAIGDCGAGFLLVGQRERGLPLIEEALTLHLVRGDDYGAAMKLTVKAGSALLAGDRVAAGAWLRESLQ